MANSTSHEPDPEPTTDRSKSGPSKPGRSKPSPSKPGPGTGTIQHDLVRGAEASAAHGNLDEASRQLDAALVLDPTDRRAIELAAAVREARISNRMGDAAQRILHDDLPRARVTLEEVLRIDPRCSEARQMLDLVTASPRTAAKAALGSKSGDRASRSSPSRWAARLGVAILVVLAVAAIDPLGRNEPAAPRSAIRVDPEPGRARSLLFSGAPRDRQPADLPTEPPSNVSWVETETRSTSPAEASASPDLEVTDLRAAVATARSLLPIDVEGALHRAVEATEAAPGSPLVIDLQTEIVSHARERAAQARREAVSFGATESETRYFRDADELFVLGDFRAEDSFAVAARSYWVAADLFARSRHAALITGVHRTIEAYETAHEAIDIAQLLQVWPDLDGARLRTIEQDFRRARQIAMRVDDCAVELRGERATATCRVERTERRRFGRQHSVAALTALDLSWSGRRWVIDRVADADS